MLVFKNLSLTRHMDMHMHMACVCVCERERESECAPVPCLVLVGVAREQSARPGAPGFVSISNIVRGCLLKFFFGGSRGVRASPD